MSEKKTIIINAYAKVAVKLFKRGFLNEANEILIDLIKELDKMDCHETRRVSRNDTQGVKMNERRKAQNF